ncbi:hypothetical protein KIK84_10345 [Curvibacter sp. CHRR-16]|uniref:hypothetical protein n=1 Tax=Curvibacter sp. CHRR-16 TaxID=2835872 RepID=UPI001BD94458|nr:hypothetical protein [Curvibacter sp. CHRR-16]MBT0570730.1 hypothetical protein [Curvibacter sp. CHRR-16]
MKNFATLHGGRFARTGILLSLCVFALTACGTITVRNAPDVSTRTMPTPTSTAASTSSIPSSTRVAAAATPETDRAKAKRHEEGLRLARLLRDQGRFTSALEVYSQLDKAQLLTPLELLEYANAAAVVSTPQESLSLFGRARRELRREGGSLDGAAQVALCTGMGRARLALKQAQEALADFDCVLGQDADNIAALNSKGVALDALGQHAQAKVQFTRALELDPANFQVLNNMALSQLALGHKADAVRLLKQAVVGGNPAIKLNLALAYLLDAQDEQAQKTLQELMPDTFAAAALKGLHERRLRIAAGASMGDEFLAASQEVLTLREGGSL